MNLILSYDTILLTLINNWDLSLFDTSIYYLSETPLLLVLTLPTFFLLFKIKGLKGLYTIAFILSFMPLTDRLISNVVKPSVARLRPCQTSNLKPLLKAKRIKACGKYGFFSNHSSNAMYFSLFFFLLLKKKVLILNFFLTFFVGLSRVYLAKHYPLDVIAGFLWGSLVAFATYKAYIFISKKLKSKSDSATVHSHVL